MDSVSQVVLGSAVSCAILGNQLGRRSLLVGAVVATLPDLDVLVDFGGAVENFVYHRSFSHSLLIQLLCSPVFAWLLLRFPWAQHISLQRWSIAIFLILSTHSLLDTFTVYGTQLLWPITDYPFAIGNLFIIDPIYTLPLLVSFIVIMVGGGGHRSAAKINSLALVISCFYIGWSLYAKILIDQKIELALARSNISPIALGSTPSAFNTLLWRGVAVTQDAHFEIYASLFDSPEEVSVYQYDSDKQLLNALPDDSRVEQLKAFSKGLYGVYRRDNAILLSDLRMGIEGAYVFTFRVGEITENGVIIGDFEQLSTRPPLAKLGDIGERIFNPHVNLSYSTH